MVKAQAATQLALYEPNPTREQEASSAPSTFADNVSLPIHRWFRYSAGFSALWVRQLIEQEKLRGRSRVFDPFCGSGTVLLEGERCSAATMGVEAHPFVMRVARAKLQWQQSPKAFRNYAFTILEQAKRQEGDVQESAKLIQNCFPPETLTR